MSNTEIQFKNLSLPEIYTSSHPSTLTSRSSFSGTLDGKNTLSHRRGAKSTLSYTRVHLSLRKQAGQLTRGIILVEYSPANLPEQSFSQDNLIEVT